MFGIFRKPGSESDVRAHMLGQYAERERTVRLMERVEKHLADKGKTDEARTVRNLRRSIEGRG